MRIAVDPLDEGATQAIDGEGARAPQRFAAGDVCLDLGPRGRAETDSGRADPLGDGLIGGAYQEVPRVQGAGAPAHHSPALAGVLSIGGLADDPAVDLQHGVATHDHLGLLRVDVRRYVECLRPGQGLHLLGGARSGQTRRPASISQLVEHGFLIDRGGSYQRLDTGGPQGGQAAGGS